MAWSFLSRLEDRFDAWRRSRGGDRTTRASLYPYFGFGTARTATLRARVLEGAVPQLPDPREVGAAGDEALAGDGAALDAAMPPVTATLKAMWNRFETDEIAGVRVEAGAGAATSDAEGYVTLTVPTDALATPGDDPRWRDITLTAPGSTSEHATARAHVLIPPDDARFLIVSDIDDTIVETNATSKLKMIPLVLTRTAAARTALPGVARLYKAFEHGGQGANGEGGLNPVFYVSSSPWNLYDLLVRFMALNAIPLGPVFLRDYGLSRHGPVGEHHELHKGNAIKTLMDTYPDKAFVLIGDSGQRDPQVYHDAARDYPGRVKGVYLRDVSPTQGLEHAANARPYVDGLKAMGVPVCMTDKSSVMAAHAAEHGLIRAQDVASVTDE